MSSDVPFFHRCRSQLLNPERGYHDNASRSNEVHKRSYTSGSLASLTLQQTKRQRAAIPGLHVDGGESFKSRRKLAHARFHARFAGDKVEVKLTWKPLWVGKHPMLGVSEAADGGSHSS